MCRAAAATALAEKWVVVPIWLALMRSRNLGSGAISTTGGKCEVAEHGVPVDEATITHEIGLCYVYLFACNIIL